jgi:hypothetical protein
LTENLLDNSMNKWAGDSAIATMIPIKTGLFVENEIFILIQHHCNYESKNPICGR